MTDGEDGNCNTIHNISNKSYKEDDSLERYVTQHLNSEVASSALSESSSSMSAVSPLIILN